VRRAAPATQTPEIGNLIGMWVPTVSRYTRLSVQKHNNVAAVVRIHGRLTLEQMLKRSHEKGSYVVEIVRC
jgi:hypothetical protein